MIGRFLSNKTIRSDVCKRNSFCQGNLKLFQKLYPTHPTLQHNSFHKIVLQASDGRIQHFVCNFGFQRCVVGWYNKTNKEFDGVGEKTSDRLIAP